MGTRYRLNIHNLRFEQKLENNHNFSPENNHFYIRENLQYIGYACFRNVQSLFVVTAAHVESDDA